jgi:adenylate cyclase
MSMEIERKFLLRSEGWRPLVCETFEILQGYICSEIEHVTRVRVVGERAWLTIKGSTEGIKRAEFEFEIDVEKAKDMLEIFCKENRIEKLRHLVKYEGHRWEIDEFKGHLEGLVVAELELAREDEEFARPEWLGDEVSHDPKYFNNNLARLKK